MKKLLSAVFALMMILSMTFAVAEETAEAVELPDLSSITAPDYDAFIENDKSETETKGTVTRDTVSISGSTYEVLTPSGIYFKYVAPNGVTALTQDFALQAPLFNRYYNNPLEVVSKWIDHGMHLNIYYATDEVDLFIYVFDTDLASIFRNSNTMTKEEAEYLFKYMQTDDEYILGATAGDYGWLGGNVWFMGDMRSTKGVVRLFSFVGGKEIYAYAKVANDTQYSDVLELLDSLVISAR